MSSTVVKDEEWEHGRVTVGKGFPGEMTFHLSPRHRTHPPCVGNDCAHEMNWKIAQMAGGQGGSGPRVEQRHWARRGTRSMDTHGLCREAMPSSESTGGRGRLPGRGRGHAGPLCTQHTEGIGGAKKRCGQLEVEVQGRLQLRAELLTKDV